MKVKNLFEDATDVAGDKFRKLQKAKYAELDKKYSPHYPSKERTQEELKIRRELLDMYIKQTGNDAGPKEIKLQKDMINQLESKLKNNLFEDADNIQKINDRIKDLLDDDKYLRDNIPPTDNEGNENPFAIKRWKEKIEKIKLEIKRLNELKKR